MNAQTFSNYATTIAKIDSIQTVISLLHEAMTQADGWKHETQNSHPHGKGVIRFDIWSKGRTWIVLNHSDDVENLFEFKRFTNRIKYGEYIYR